MSPVAYAQDNAVHLPALSRPGWAKLPWEGEATDTFLRVLHQMPGHVQYNLVKAKIIDTAR
jgi:hypothetical protein